MLIAAAFAVSFLPTAASTASPEHAIAYRQDLMKTLEAQFQAITLIVIAGAPAENLHSHLVAALLTARALPLAFERRAPGGSSQPQIWTNGNDFDHQMRHFEASIAMAVEAAKNGTPVEGVLYHLDAISCRTCHDRYRRY
jgi:cytochrome c556